MIGAEYAIAAYVLGLGLMLGYGLRVGWRLRASLRGASERTGGPEGGDQAEAASDERSAEPASVSRAR